VPVLGSVLVFVQSTTENLTDVQGNTSPDVANSHMLQVVLTSPRTGKPMVDANGQHACISVSVGLSGSADNDGALCLHVFERMCTHPSLSVPLIMQSPSVCVVYS
jgi:hypothetical protein